MAAVGQDVGIEDSTPAILRVRRCVSTQTMTIKMGAPPSTTLRAHDDHPVSAATTTMGMLSSLTSLRYLLVTSYKDTQQQSVPLVLWVLVHNITRRRVREIDDGTGRHRRSSVCSATHGRGYISYRMAFDGISRVPPEYHGGRGVNCTNSCAGGF